MKTLAWVCLVFFCFHSYAARGEELAISVTEHSSRGVSKEIASVRAEDEAARKEILNLWDEAVGAFPKDRRNLFGPDSGFVTITLTRGKRMLTVRSWHPLFERNPDLIVTSHGVEPLDGRKREEVLKSDEAWYRSARKCFDRIMTFTITKAGS